MNGTEAARSLIFNYSPVILFNEARHNQRPPLFVFSCDVLLFLFLVAVRFIFWLHANVACSCHSSDCYFIFSQVKL